MKGNACLILGSGPQALYLLRKLSGEYNEVVLLGEHNWITFSSRYGKKKIVQDDRLIGEIESVLETFGRQTPIYISGGKYLAFLLKNIELFDYNTYPRPLEAILALNDKASLNRFVEERKLRIRLLETGSLDGGLGCGFPWIVKWRTDSPEKKFKTILLNNRDDLNALGERTNGIRDDLIVQRYIKDKDMFACAGYAEEGKTLQKVVVHYFRQQPNGLSCHIKELSNGLSNEISRQACELIGAAKLTGYFEVEFILDRTTSQLYLNEVNPRPWGWIDYLRYMKPGENGEMIIVHRDIFQLYKENPGMRKLAVRLVEYIRIDKAYWKLTDPLPFFGAVLNNLFRKS